MVVGVVVGVVGVCVVFGVFGVVVVVCNNGFVDVGGFGVVEVVGVDVCVVVVVAGVGSLREVQRFC